VPKLRAGEIMGFTVIVLRADCNLVDDYTHFGRLMLEPSA